jgi:hypothetical protein
MRDGLRRTREVLGNDIPGLTDKVIEDTLWNYYFDVPQTVNYILSACARAGGSLEPYSGRLIAWVQRNTQNPSRRRNQKQKVLPSHFLLLFVHHYIFA